MGKGCGPLKIGPRRGDIPWMFLTEIFGVMEFVNIVFTHIFLFFNRDNINKAHIGSIKMKH